jgi:phospholipid transport system transporter-binding protein
MLVLPSRLTHDEAPACVYMLQQGLEGQAETATVVDASALVHFDSSALAVLLEVRRESSARGRGFAVKGLPARLRELAALYGVAGLLPAAP